MPDYWAECLQDPALEPVSRQGEEAFARHVCRVCRNPECDRVLARDPKSNPWVERMSTQEERLLINPRFADIQDPRFGEVRRVDFESAARQAIALEIAAERGDWTVPTAADAVEYLARSQKVVAPESEATPPERLVDEVKVIEDASVPTKLEAAKSERSQCRHCHTRILKGTQRFGRFVSDPLLKGQEVWTWYHVPCAAERFPEELAALQSPAPVAPTAPAPVVSAAPTAPAASPSPPPPPQTPVESPRPVPASRTPQPVVGPERQQFVPRMPNTPMPTGGIMIGGGSPPAPSATPPAHDPWAAPAPSSGKKVAVGATIRMGGDSKED